MAQTRTLTQRLWRWLSKSQPTDTPAIERERRERMTRALADRLMETTEAKGTAREMLYFLAVHADETGEVEMGQETLAMRFDLASPKSVQPHLRKLRDLGALTIVQRGQFDRPNRYRITDPPA